MIKIFTRDDVIRYIFNETTEEESYAIKCQLLTDAKLAEFHKQSKNILNQLESLTMEPSENIIQQVLDYSSIMAFHSIS